MTKCWCYQYHSYKLGTSEQTECECCADHHLSQALHELTYEEPKSSSSFPWKRAIRRAVVKAILVFIIVYCITILILQA